MSNEPWLTSAQLRAWMRFIAVVELLPGALDSQLQRDAELSHFEYLVLAMLSQAPHRTLRMTDVGELTNSSLSRLSHVVARLEKRGLVERTPCAEDRRATNASLTEAGWVVVQASAPGHVRNVRENVIDLLSDEQVAQLEAISDALLQKLDPANKMRALDERGR